MRFPDPLQKGDIIGVCAPSSGVFGPFLEKLDNSINFLEHKGYRILQTSSVRKNFKTTSASPEQRVSEFMTLYENPNVKVIIPPWGGEFLMEILPLLNYDKLSILPPKWILGFSDISSLLFSLSTKLNIATAHGPNLLDFGFNVVDDSVENVLKILECKYVFTQNNLPAYQNKWCDDFDEGLKRYDLSHDSIWKTLNKEDKLELHGRLIGGCMDVLCKLINTPYEGVKNFLQTYKDDGFIWFLESCEMNSADIYRTLWQMKECGFFNNCSGVLFGRLTGYSDVADFTYIDALERVFNSLNISVIYDVDLGHKPPQLTFINGAYCDLFYENGKSTIIQKFK